MYACVCKILVSFALDIVLDIFYLNMLDLAFRRA